MRGGDAVRRVFHDQGTVRGKSKHRESLEKDIGMRLGPAGSYVVPRDHPLEFGQQTESGQVRRWRLAAPSTWPTPGTLSCPASPVRRRSPRCIRFRRGAGAIPHRACRRSIWKARRPDRTSRLPSLQSSDTSPRPGSRSRVRRRWPSTPRPAESPCRESVHQNRIAVPGCAWRREYIIAVCGFRAACVRQGSSKHRKTRCSKVPIGWAKSWLTMTQPVLFCARSTLRIGRPQVRKGRVHRAARVDGRGQT